MSSDSPHHFSPFFGVRVQLIALHQVGGYCSRRGSVPLVIPVHCRDAPSSRTGFHFQDAERPQLAFAARSTPAEISVSRLSGRVQR